jgi:dihydrofolate reductase
MEFFLHFQRMHPLIIIGKRMFDSLRPYWVKKMKDRNVCCYIYHVEMKELKVGFNT